MSSVRNVSGKPATTSSSPSSFGMYVRMYILYFVLIFGHNMCRMWIIFIYIHTPIVVSLSCLGFGSIFGNKTTFNETRFSLFMEIWSIKNLKLKIEITYNKIKKNLVHAHVLDSITKKIISKTSTTGFFTFFLFSKTFSYVFIHTQN